MWREQRRQQNNLYPRTRVQPATSSSDTQQVWTIVRSDAKLCNTMAFFEVRSVEAHTYPFQNYQVSFCSQHIFPLEARVLSGETTTENIPWQEEAWCFTRHQTIHACHRWRFVWNVWAACNQRSVLYAIPQLWSELTCDRVNQWRVTTTYNQ